MDGVWLIIDSLSFRDTPFAADGPETMPELAEVAADHAVTFTSAYAPGPLSPSSHAAMFTGCLPSAAGMHEAHPYFDGGKQTIAGALSESHRTALVSLNMWLSQGLNEDFDEFEDFSRQYLISRTGTDPKNYFRKHDPDGSALTRLLKFALHDRRPLRSLANYLSYRRSDGSLVPEEWGDDENYQYAEQLNDHVRSKVRNSKDTFVVANYMDIHPPFDASDEALDIFAPDRSRADLPINTSPERHIPNEKKSYNITAMDTLYRAAIWDIDKKITPLIRDLVDRGVFVVVTSDHGIWNSDTAYAENRVNIPLLIFHPDESARTVDDTVNLRSLPRTTVRALTGDNCGFEGADVLSIRDDHMSVTEIIHHPNDIYRETGRVDVTKSAVSDQEIQRDLVLVQGNTRVDYIGGSWSPVRGSESDCRELITAGQEILRTELRNSEFEGGEYDTVTERRLKDLGYM